MFYGCSSLKSITIPEGVTSIGVAAFYGCPLTSVDLPSSVALIYEAAFGGCMDLTDLTIRNPKCEIGKVADPDTGFGGILSSHPTIHGYDGSTAQTYAKAYGLTFKSLGKAPSGGTTSAISPPRQAIS